jgi:hypothetical protein
MLSFSRISIVLLRYRNVLESLSASVKSHAQRMVDPEGIQRVDQKWPYPWNELRSVSASSSAVMKEIDRSGLR